MKNIKGDYFIFCGELKPSDQYTGEMIIGGKSLYEVIRINNRKPLFLNLHYNRLVKSGQITNIEVPDLDTTKLWINELIERNRISEGNIELVVNDPIHSTVRFILHHYPTTIDYQNGVSVKLYDACRELPNAKVKRVKFRNKIDQFIAKHDIFEILFVNENKILEGSRSNVFFVKDNGIYTAAVKDVLPGITRMVTLDICQKLGYNIFEENIMVEDIKKYSSAFITGTSPGILPIKQIEDKQMDVHNDVLRKIMNEFSIVTQIKI